MANGVILGQTLNTNGLLPLDGSRAMTGRLNMSNHKITNLADVTADTDAVNFKTIQPYRTGISGGLTATICVTFHNIIMDVTSTGTSGTSVLGLKTNDIFWLLPQLLGTTNTIIQSWQNDDCTGTFMDMNGTSMPFECDNVDLALHFPSNLSVGTHIFYLHDITYSS